MNETPDGASSLSDLQRTLALLASFQEENASRASELLDGHPELAPLLGPLLEDALHNDHRGGDAQPDKHRVGPYVLEMRLGGGGQGVVWLARDPEGASVALKVIRPGPASDASEGMRVRQEAAITSRLNHPGLCGSLASGYDDGCHWIAFPFIHGINLEEALMIRAQPPTDSAGCEPWVKIARDLANALAYAHRMQAVHRDVKPSNVLITTNEGRAPLESDLSAVLMDGQWAVTLVDFGIAIDQSQARFTGDGRVVGTSHFMAPEQILGGHVDGQADVFALGVLLFNCLTGEYPYEASTLADYRARLETGDPPSLKAVHAAADRDLGAILERALSIPTGRRYQDAEQLETDLNKWLAGSPVAARPLPPWNPAWRWTRRHPVKAIIAASAAALLAVLLWSSLRVTQAERLADATEALALGKSLAAVGDWEGATRQFVEAADGAADPVAVEIEMVQMLQAQHRFEEANERLALLRKRGALGPHGPMVDLLWFDPSTPGNPDGVRPGWRAAYERYGNSEALPLAWREYARACTASHMPECRVHLLKALEADQRHRPSSELLVSVALFSGSLADAKSAARDLRMKWPGDPVAASLDRGLSGEPAPAGALPSAALQASIVALLGLRGDVRALGDWVRARQIERVLQENSGQGFALGFVKRAHAVISMGMRLDGAGMARLRLPPPLRSLSVWTNPEALLARVLRGSAGRDQVLGEADEVAAVLGSPSCRVLTRLGNAATGNFEKALQGLERIEGEQDWISSEGGVAVWRVLVLCTVVTEMDRAGQDPPTRIRERLARAVRRALESNSAASPLESSLLGLGATLAENPQLMLRCATWLCDHHPGHPLAIRTAASLFGHAGQHELGLQLLDSLSLEDPVDPRVEQLRSELAAGAEPTEGPGLRDQR